MDIYSSYVRLAHGIANTSIFPEDITREKNILVIGDNNMGRMVEGKEGEYTPTEIFCEDMSVLGAKSCSVLATVYGGNVDLYKNKKNKIGAELKWSNIDEEFPREWYGQFDVVVLLEGLEKATNLFKAAQNILDACIQGGDIYLMTRTKDDMTAGPHSHIFWYEDNWRFNDTESLDLFQNVVFVNKYSLSIDRSNKMTWSLVHFKSDKESNINESGKFFSCYGQSYINPVKLSEQGFFRENALNRIGTKWGTDKAERTHNYLHKYEMFLSKWRDDEFTLLELGVAQGSSELMWQDYFQFAQIVGVDIEESCLKYSGNRIKILQMDLGNKENLEKLKTLNPRIIIDDASHFWSHQIMALFVLFDSLPSGGIYIIEDMETSLNLDLCGSGWTDNFPVNPFSICQRIIHVVASKKNDIHNDAFSDKITSIGLCTEMAMVIKGAFILVKR